MTNTNYSLIKLYQPSCNPCKMVTDHLKRLGLEESDYTSFDLTKNPEKGGDFGIMGVPVTILLENGKEIQRSISFKPDELEEMVNKLKGE